MNHTPPEPQPESPIPDATIQPETQQATADGGLLSFTISREMIVGALSFIIFMTALTVFVDRVGLAQLQDAVADAGPLAPLLYIAIKALTYVFAPLTSGPIQLSAGLVFGLWPGVFYTLLGETLGGMVSFLIARHLGRPVVRRFVGEAGMAQVDKFYRENLGGWQSLAVARLVLFSVWDFLSYAAGFTQVRLQTYLMISFLVGFWPTLVFVGLGSALGQSTETLIFAYALIAVILVLTVVLRKPIMRLLQQVRQ